MEVQILKSIERFKVQLLLSVALLTAIASANAQYVIKEADTQFALDNFHKSADLYEQAYRKKATLHAAERAAESYAAQSDYRQAESWYAIASTMKGSDPKNILEYAKALQSNGKYSEAKAQYVKYFGLDNSVSASEQRIRLNSCDSALLWMRNPTDVKLTNEKPLNSTESDWAAIKQNENVIFVSDRIRSGQTLSQSSRPFLKFDSGKKPSRVYFGGTGNGYLSLYEKSLDKDSVTALSVESSTPYHIGPATFTADGKTIYFAQSQANLNTGKISTNPKIGKLKTLLVEIFTATKDASGSWANPTPFKYNKPGEYSVGDPFITPDGMHLFFTSDMPGGTGGLDLYVCEMGADGEWNEPLNLKELNSGGNDRSPNLAPNGVLYFSSDGRIGMGGLDVYKSAWEKGVFSKPVNMHYPTNSPQDDFAFNMYNETDGYLSSNRVGGVGNDDIYHFAMKKLVELYLTGKVFDKNTNVPLANALVTLSKIGGEALKVESDESGAFKFKLEEASDYKLSGEKTDYRGDNATLSTKGLNSSNNLDQNLYLEKIAINRAIRLENIYYDFDKANIRADAAIELDKLVKIMQDNPTIWIELGSHTDSRGSDAYNLDLSQRRAESAVKYIVSRGINKNRIEAKGYGETQSLNRCSNGVNCTVAEHQLNRRTEFKITKQ